MEVELVDGKRGELTFLVDGRVVAKSLCENSGFLLFFSGFLDFSHRL